MPRPGSRRNPSAPGSPNPDYNENLFPDEQSTFMHLFHDRRNESRRDTSAETRGPWCKDCEDYHW